MNCCQQCEGIESLFDDKTARKELKRYRNKGPDKATLVLLDALKAEGVEGLTLLDIGAGVGAIHHELLNAGATQATDVDASTAYLEAARQEAERQGHADQVSYHHGDFVELASEMEEADVVTLDRVLCCYHDMKALVELSTKRANKLYGLVFPQNTWFVKIGLAVGNFFLWITRDPFRTFMHRTEAVDAIARQNGLERRFHRNAGLIWQVVVYERNGAA
jgi:magnesium-protoporphyrin O-methyltransferase